MIKVYKAAFITVLLTTLIAFIGGPDLQAEEKKRIFNIKVDHDIMKDPHAFAAWREYGKFKQEWRQALFFEQFPDEKEYRYSYKEELDCRKRLALYWADLKKANPGIENEYLDDLLKVYNSFYFPEYIYKHFRKSSWEVRKDRFRLDEYKKWAKEFIRGHHSGTYAELEEIEL